MHDISSQVHASRIHFAFDLWQCFCKQAIHFQFESMNATDIP